MGKRAVGTAWLAIWTAVVMALAGCTNSGSGSDPSGQPSNEGRDLVIGASLEPESLDMTTASGAAIPQLLLYNVYETLVKTDQQGEIKPLLAQSWQVSDDLLTYTFSLRNRAQFASGEPVDAEAVKASLDRSRSGAKVVSSIQQQLAPITSVTAVDDNTVELTLSRPSNNLLFWLTGSAGIIVDPTGVDTLSSATAGSGPFEAEEWNKGDSVTLTRNQNYWGTPPRVDQVVWRYFADANALTSAMLAGDLDIISDLTTPEAIDQFSDTERFTVLEGTTNGEVVLGFNHTNKALAKFKVRQAINHAIDRQALLDVVWGGKGEMIGSMVPPTDPWYEDLSGTYPYDPDKAKQLLAEAGEDSGLTLNLRVPTLPYGPSAAQFIAAQLKDVGIAVKVDELEFATWLDQVYTKGNYDMTIVAHVEPRDIGRWADPDYYWKYDNPDFQKLIEQADQADSEEANDLMARAAKILADDAAADFLFLLPNLVVTTADITGVAQNSTSESFDLTSVASSKG